MIKMPILNLTRMSEEELASQQRRREVTAALEALGESQDELGSIARKTLVAELVAPLIERYVGHPVPADPRATDALDFRERVATGAVVMTEAWRQQRQREAQERTP